MLNDYFSVHLLWKSSLKLSLSSCLFSFMVVFILLKVSCFVICICVHFAVAAVCPTSKPLNLFNPLGDRSAILSFGYREKFQ